MRPGPGPAILASTLGFRRPGAFVHRSIGPAILSPYPHTWWRGTTCAVVIERMRRIWGNQNEEPWSRSTRRGGGSWGRLGRGECLTPPYWSYWWNTTTVGEGGYLNTDMISPTTDRLTRNQYRAFDYLLLLSLISRKVKLLQAACSNVKFEIARFARRIPKSPCRVVELPPLFRLCGPHSGFRLSSPPQSHWLWSFLVRREGRTLNS